jgi:hypothetical protein
MPPTSCSGLVPALLVAAAALAACSPTFNWREVPVGNDGLVALLPCKADRAGRQLPLGAESVAVDMAGCEAGGATFAVAHARAADPTQAEAWMKAWRTATRAQLAGARIVESAAVLPRAASSPAPVRLDSDGAAATATQALPGANANTNADATGQAPPAPAHILWFAQRRGDGGVSLYQATVLGKPASAEALGTFFEGLRIP